MVFLLFSFIQANEIGNCEQMDGEGNTCFKCETNYYLTQNLDECLEECPKGQYPDNDGLCQSCQLGTFPMKNINDQWVCQECGLGCQICYTIDKCEKCENQEYYSYYGICIEYCDIEDGEYVVENDGEQQFCYDCMENCDQCDNDVTCKFCAESYFINKNLQCTQDCGQDLYGDLVDRICKSCGSGKYLNPDLKDGETNYCLDCGTGCQECKSKKNCEKCQFGKNVKADDGSCFVSCPIKKGYFKDGEGNCLSCAQNCAECENKESCQNCKENYFMQYEDESGSCLETCNGDPDQVYANQITRKCEICGDGKFKIQNPEKPFEYCGDCQKNCKVCQDSESLCKTCYNEFKYKDQDGSCFSQCNIENGQYEKVEDDGEGYFCLDCIQNCSTCNNSENCEKCNNKTFLLAQQCQSACNDGEFGDKSDRICKNCSENCASCTGLEQCQECKEGYLFQQACTDQCPAIGYYGKDRVCESCLVGCQMCEDGKSCELCYKEYFRQQDNKGKFQGCKKECPKQGYFQTQDEENNEKQCIECIDNCNQCSSSNTCTTCIDGTYLNTYENEMNQKVGKCEICNIKCKTCEQRADRCLNCALQEYPYLENHTCVKSCSKGYYIDKNNICQFDDSTNQWWIYLLVILGIVILLGIFALIIIRYRKNRQQNNSQRAQGSNASDYISIQQYNREEE
ncbi:Insulin-like growth factor binding protein, N-terminal [Pseudocohnilembus persalinus]|uniref:Insulin-like growth factor binding protein, N-terminal n=1 Tax=Pseudocohnilembus persalinus TaxID=266149 RepID=A0A0V0QN51_PSEPJ|nr:Insulin-like growth factor binding protein, N-terminal [Pseudocohnilembus persalinus]|eukprot:KRX03779.1 Insulin-like growth factor binding protein, N-terminal [Pseudocohnilembus persalinus]